MLPANNSLRTANPVANEAPAHDFKEPAMNSHPAIIVCKCAFVSTLVHGVFAIRATLRGH